MIHSLGVRHAIVGFGIALALVGTLAAQTPVRSATDPMHLSLDEALGIADSASQSILIARAGVLRAEGQEKKAFSQFLPQLYGSLSYTRTLQSQYSGLGSVKIDSSALCSNFVPDTTAPLDQRVRLTERAIGCSSGNPFSSFSSVGFGAPNGWSAGVTFTQVIFAGGRYTGQYHSAQAGRRSAELGLTATQAQLVLQVTRAYFDAQLSDKLVEIAEQTLAQAETTLTQTKLAREVGNQPEFDLIRAQVTRDNQVPVVVQRRADREQAYYQLRTLLRLPMDQAVQLTTTLDDTSRGQSVRLASVLAEPLDTVISRRIPVRQAVENLTSGQEQLTVARSQYWPAITLSSGYGGVSYPTTAFPTNVGQWRANWTVTGALSIPLFTGGSIHADVMQAQANLQEAQARLRATEDLARIDTRDALNQLAAARASYAASQGTAVQAGRAYSIAEVRYREGISTQTELRDARLQLQQAQANQAQAARDVRVALVRVALLPELPIIVNTGTTAPGTSGSLLNPTPQATTPPAVLTRTTQAVGQPVPAVPAAQIGVTP